MRVELVDEALLALLRSLVDGNSDPLNIGDAQAPFPPDGEAVPATPYAVLYPWAQGDPEDGGLNDPHRQRRLSYRVLSVSWSRQSATWMADQIHSAIVDRGAGGYTHAIAPTGITVIRRRCVSRGPTRLEGTLWNVDEEFSLHCLPSS